MKYVAFGCLEWQRDPVICFDASHYLISNCRSAYSDSKTTWRIFQILRTFLIVLIGYMFDIGNNFSAAIDMLGRCVMDFSFDVTQIIEQITSCGMTLYDYILLIFMTVLIFYVSLIQERHPDTTIRRLLEEKYPNFSGSYYLQGFSALPYLECTDLDAVQQNLCICSSSTACLKNAFR